MNRERWHQITEILDAALLRDASERASFLDSACSGDDELRREVESLLAYDGRAVEFISSSAWTGRLCRGPDAAEKKPRADPQRFREICDV